MSFSVQIGAGGNISDQEAANLRMKRMGDMSEKKRLMFRLEDNEDNEEMEFGENLLLILILLFLTRPRLSIVSR